MQIRWTHIHQIVTQPSRRRIQQGPYTECSAKTARNNLTTPPTQLLRLGHFTRAQLLGLVFLVAQALGVCRARKRSASLPRWLCLDVHVSRGVFRFLAAPDARCDLSILESDVRSLPSSSHRHGFAMPCAKTRGPGVSADHAGSTQRER